MNCLQTVLFKAILCQDWATFSSFNFLHTIVPQLCLWITKMCWLVPSVQPLPLALSASAYSPCNAYGVCAIFFPVVLSAKKAGADEVKVCSLFQKYVTLGSKFLLFISWSDVSVKSKSMVSQLAQITDLMKGLQPVTPHPRALSYQGSSLSARALLQSKKLEQWLRQCQWCKHVMMVNSLSCIVTRVCWTYSRTFLLSQHEACCGGVMSWIWRCRLASISVVPNVPASIVSACFPTICSVTDFSSYALSPCIICELPWERHCTWSEKAWKEAS